MGRRTTSVDTLLTAYYRHVAAEDVADRSDVDLYGAFASHYKLAANRPQGTARVRVFTPTTAEHGWSAEGHSVVEVVIDDMPFLVDSLTMELSRQLRDVHLVIHPLLRRQPRHHRRAARRPPGRRAADDAPATPRGTGEEVRESWMHVEIDRLAEGEDVAAIEDAVQRVLRDVRESVEDWAKMHAQVDDIVRELETAPAGVGADEVAAGARAAPVAGRRPLHVPRLPRVRASSGATTASTCAPCPAPGSASCAPTRTWRPRGRLPEAAAAKAREKTVLVLTKANSRSTVHRPAYLDYVGVKKFENGEVVGERRFLGLFSSAAYTESLTRIPLLRERAAAVLKRIGFDPQQP